MDQRSLTSDEATAAAIMQDTQLLQGNRFRYPDDCLVFRLCGNKGDLVRGYFTGKPFSRKYRRNEPEDSFCFGRVRSERV